jgi:hypothetical protein
MYAWEECEQKITRRGNRRGAKGIACMQWVSE